MSLDKQALRKFADPLPIISKARKTNAIRDNIDLKNGFAPPNRCSLDVFLKTAMGAILCGLQTEDFDCIAEGYVMLEDMHSKLTNNMKVNG